MNTNTETNQELKLCIGVLVMAPFFMKGQSMSGFDVIQLVRKIFDDDVVDEALKQIKEAR